MQKVVAGGLEQRWGSVRSDPHSAAERWVAWAGMIAVEVEEKGQVEGILSRQNRGTEEGEGVKDHSWRSRLFAWLDGLFVWRIMEDTTSSSPWERGT